MPDNQYVFNNAKGEDYDPAKVSYGVIDPNTRKAYGVMFGDVEYSLNINTGEKTNSIVADASRAINYSQEQSLLGNQQLGCKNCNGNVGISEPIITVHIFIGSVNYFTNPHSPFYTNGHLPNQTQIDKLTNFLIHQYNIQLP